MCCSFTRALIAGCLFVPALLGAAPWEVTNGPNMMVVSSLSPHPNRAGEILVCSVSGAFLTADAGLTYSQAISGNPGAIYRHPADPELVLAALFKTSWDGGRTWSDRPDHYEGFAAQSTDPTLVYGFGNRSGSTESWIEVKASTDRARTFVPRGTLAQAPREVDVVAAGVDATDNRILYCLVSERASGGSRTRGMFKSLDGGSSWTTLTIPDSMVASIACDPVEHDAVYLLGSRGLYLSADGGASWTSLLRVAPTEDDRCIVNPRGNGEIWISVRSGWRYSIDWGNTWTSMAMPGLTGSGVIHFAPAFGQAGSVYAGHWEDLSRTADGGRAWVSVPLPQVPASLANMAGSIAVDPIDPDRVYSGMCCTGPVFGSRNGGATWERLYQSETRGIAVDPAEPSHVFLLTQGSGLQESYDFGTNWHGLSGLISRTSRRWVSALYSPDQFSTLYVGIGGNVSVVLDRADSASWGQVFASTDAGETWSRVPFDEPNRGIQGVAVKPGRPDTMVVVTSDAEVFRSVDGGVTWGLAYAGRSTVSDDAVNAPVAVSRLNPGVMALVTSSRLLVTEDFGSSWEARTPAGMTTSGHFAGGGAVFLYPLGTVRLVVPTGQADGTLYVSDDLGRSWATYSTGIQDQLVALAASNDGTFYSTTPHSGVVKGRVTLPGVSTGSLRFEAPVGTTVQRLVTVSNPGADALEVGPLTISGRNISQFQVTPSTMTIAAGQSQTVTVTFAPTSSGTKSAAVSIPYDAQAGAFSVALTGVAFVPGTITTVLESGSPELAIPGGLGPAGLGGIRAMIVDASGSVLLGLARLLRMSPGGQVTVVAGTGQDGFSGDGGPATQARFLGVNGLAVGSDGSIYFSSEGNQRIRRVDPAGIITTFAGTGQAGFSGDGGPASQATLNSPGGLAIDAGGNLYLADASNARVRRVSPEGIISTIAGTGVNAHAGDGGPANQAALESANAIALDARGAIYIAEYRGHSVRRVSPEGLITTVAGTGELGYSGDGGLATEARLSYPSGLAVDASGNLYIAEWEGYRVRRVSPEGIITTFAGTGEPGFSGDGGPATQARIGPFPVAVGDQGVVYIADARNGRIRKVSPADATTPIPSSPSIRLSAGSLVFVSTQTSATSQQTFTIANTGTASLVVSGITVTGVNANQFSVTPSTFTIPAGGSAQTVAVTFAPTSSGTKSAALSIPHNAAGSPSSVALTGTAVAVPAPDISVSPASVDFGQARVGGTSGATLTLQNAGTLALVVDSIRVTGSAFGVSPASATVVPGGRADLALTFLPTRLGAATGELVLVTNDPDEHRVSVPLSGTGRLSHVTVSVDTLSFGRVMVGQSSSQILTITNNSSTAITVSNVVPGDPQYTVSSRTFTLAAGGSRDVTVTVTPLEGRALASTLTVLTNDTEVPALTVVLAATSGVVGGVPVITLLPTSLTFGSVGIGQSRTATLFVTNDGGTNLRVVNVVSSSGDVSVSETGFTVAPGGEKQVIVTLQPSQAGSFSETLELQSNDPARPLVTIPLRATVTTGTGRPTLALDTPSLSFGQVAIGETSEFLLPVRNAGTATLTISNAVSDNVQVVASPTSMSVPPQETRSLTVRYRPLPGMPLSGRLTLYSNDTAQPQVGVTWSAVEVRSPYLSLTRMTPADGAFGVATTAEIQLVFSEPLYYRRGFTALDVAVTPEPLSGPVEEDVQVRGDGRTVVIPVTLARNTVYRLVVYGATGRSGLELFDMVEASFSTGAAPPVLAKVSGRVTEATGLAVSGSVYLMDSSHRLSAQTSVAMDGSFELAGVGEGSYTLYLDGAIADGRVATGAYDANGDGVADVLTVRAGLDQTGLTMTTTVRSGTTPVVSSGLVAVDLDSSSGNQGQTSLGGVAGDQAVVLEVYATAAEGWTGAAVTVAFDSTKVSFAGASEGDNLLRRNGGTALFLSHVDPLASTVEYGGAILGATATTAVSGSGLLGRFRFTLLDGFSGESVLRVTLVKVHTLTGRTDVEPNLTATLRSSGGSSTPPTSTGPLTLDFNTADGDQGQTAGSSAVTGKTYQVQVHAVGAPTINGWSAKVEYDPVQVRYVSGSFQPSTLVPGLVSLVEEKSNYVSIGGAVLGGSGTGSGSGLLGSATFEVLSGFSGETELVIRQMSWKVVGSGEQMQTVEIRGTITAATAGLAGDFNSDGAVNFSDFFLFADAFGGSDPAYDLNGDGAVNFSDFFVFADAFGSEARAKLIELAQHYLGLPAPAGIESAYPNPFNASTTVRYRLAEAGSVQLAVYSLTGQRVALLVVEWQEAGSHQATWDGRAEDGTAVATGTYLVRLASPDGVQVRKVTLLR